MGRWTKDRRKCAVKTCMNRKLWGENYCSLHIHLARLNDVKETAVITPPETRDECHAV